MLTFKLDNTQAKNNYSEITKTSNECGILND